MAFKLEPTGRRRRGRIGATLSEINIIPLVDVILVLLLIFMLTAPLMHRGIDVNLPKSAAKPTAVEERMVLTLTKDQTVFLNDKPVAIGALDAAAARRCSRTARTRRSTSRPTRGCSTGSWSRPWTASRRAGVEKLGMVTEPHEGHGDADHGRHHDGVADAGLPRHGVRAGAPSGFRARLHGPAMARRRLPSAALTLSAIGHVFALVVITAGIIWGGVTSPEGVRGEPGADGGRGGQSGRAPPILRCPRGAPRARAVAVRAARARRRVRPALAEPEAAGQPVASEAAPRARRAASPG